MKIELTAGDVRLRKFRQTDSVRMVELANNENISRNLRDGFPYPYTLRHAKDFIDRCLSMHPPTIFAIEYKGEYVGNIGLMKGVDVYRKSAEVGYFIGEEYWGKGIATIALNLACEYGFNHLDVIRIHAGVYEHNLASQRVLEKAGFTKEGVFKNAVFKQEKFWNEVRYAKIRL